MMSCSSGMLELASYVGFQPWVMAHFPFLYEHLVSHLAGTMRYDYLFGSIEMLGMAIMALSLRRFSNRPKQGSI